MVSKRTLYDRAWRKRNMKRYLSYQAKYRAEHRDERRRYAEEYRKKNRALLAVKMQAYRKACK